MSVCSMIKQKESVDMNGNVPSFKRLEKNVVKRRMKEFEPKGEEEKTPPTSPLNCDERRNWPILKQTPSKSPILGPSSRSVPSGPATSRVLNNPSKLQPGANNVPTNGMPIDSAAKQSNAVSPIIADRLSMFQSGQVEKSVSGVVGAPKVCVRDVGLCASSSSAHPIQDNRVKNGELATVVSNFSNRSEISRTINAPVVTNGDINSASSLITRLNATAERVCQGNVVTMHKNTEIINCSTPDVNTTNSLSRNKAASAKPPLRPKPALDNGSLSRGQSINRESATSNDSTCDEYDTKTSNAPSKPEIGTISVPCEFRPIPSPRSKKKPLQQTLSLSNLGNSAVAAATSTIAPPPKPPRLLSSFENQFVDNETAERSSSKELNDYCHLTDTHSRVSGIDYYLDLDHSRSNQSPPASSNMSPLIQSRLMELTQQLQKKQPGQISGEQIDRSPRPKPLKPLQFEEELNQDAWEKKFIRAKPIPQAHDKASGMGKKKLNNPSYMYATVRRPDDIISGRRGLLHRHRSDDMLDCPTSETSLGQDGVNSSDDCGIYYDPNSIFPGETPKVVAADRTKRAVRFDTEGYAIPSVAETANNLSVTGNTKLTGRMLSNHTNNNNGAVNNHSEQNRVKSKISNAYAVLRWNVLPRSDGSQSDEDRESELDMEEHRKRLRHVTQVKQKTYEAVARYEIVKHTCDMRLFQYALIVGLEPEDPESTVVPCRYKPYVKFCFPKQVSESDRFASNLCFPDADRCKPVLSYDGDLFSFVLTNAEAERKFGWCWRYLPPGDGARLPEAVCIVSPLGELSLYEQLLKAVQECRAQSIDSAQELLQVAYARPFPAPNNEVYIRTVGPDFKRKMVTLKRPAESRLNNVTFNLLFSKLSLEVLLQVYAAVLLERKVIMCSEDLHTLTSCVFTIIALLYPFEWQHTLVTVLPCTLIDLVDAPTPYILGIHKSTELLKELERRELDGVLVVDLDNSTLVYKVGDENRIIPRKIMKALHNALEEPDDVGCIVSGDSLRNRRISDSTVTEAFLRLFVETCGHYTEYICNQQNGERVFQRELFVKAVSCRGIHMFLEWFTQTQMFEVFVTDKLKESSTAGLFEERIMEYRQEMSEVESSIKGSVKAVGKKIAGFFRDSGDRIKKTFQKNVYV